MILSRPKDTVAVPDLQGLHPSMLVGRQQHPPVGQPRHLVQVGDETVEHVRFALVHGVGAPLCRETEFAREAHLAPMGILAVLSAGGYRCHLPAPYDPELWPHDFEDLPD